MMRIDIPKGLQPHTMLVILLNPIRALNSLAVPLRAVARSS